MVLLLEYWNASAVCHDTFSVMLLVGCNTVIAYNGENQAQLVVSRGARAPGASH
jgi:hypothetical protein